MQSILLVSSVQQLQRCLPYTLDLNQESDSNKLAVWILADSNSSLLAFAKKETQELEIECDVRCVPEDDRALLALLNEWRHADWLILPYADEQQSLFIKLFEQSPCRTVLLDPGIDARKRPTRLIEAVANDQRSIDAIAECYPDVATTLLHGNLDVLLAQEKSERRELLNAAIDDHQLQPSDIIVSTVERDTSSSDDYLIARALLDLELPAAVMIIRQRMGILEHAWSRIEKQITHFVPPLEREARLELSNTLETNSSLHFDFLALMSAATCLAAFGLVQNSAAVIIGAMLVAPLMSPIMGAGLALAQGNFPLFKRASTTVAVGFACALVTSACFGLLVRWLQGSEITTEMWARSGPSLLDFLVGFVGGLAAAYARSRPHLSDALAGAAIAAALVPPIATAGLQLAFLPLGLGHEKPQGVHTVIGPILLFFANVMTIMVATWIVLWLSGIHGDHRFGTRQRWANRAVIILMAITILAAVVIFETR